VKKWNGWGLEDTLPTPLAPEVIQILNTLFGELHPSPDATLTQVLAGVPSSRLEDHPLVTTDPEDRLRHARGQSLPDWVALRSGRINAFPDGVAYPSSDEEVRSLLSYASKVGASLIPYGGGTSVVGQINIVPGDQPVFTVDLRCFNNLLDLDETSLLASYGAGITGPQIEASLNVRGYTMGHFPQSFEYSTLGGWIATRSVGTQCYRYGRIEDLFVGGHIETPIGQLDIPIFPASSAGPDLRELILGSEGRLGIITRATVRVSPLPQRESFHAAFFPTIEYGFAAMREIIQARVPVSMVRLSDSQETENSLVFTGRKLLISAAHKGIFGIGSERCLMIFGVTGDSKSTRLAYRQARAMSRAHGGFVVRHFIGNEWHKSRFKSPYLRNTLWDVGLALDTLETALPFSKALAAFEGIKDAIRSTGRDIGEVILVFGHFSHVYMDGTNLYITYMYRRSQDPDETLENWKKFKSAASEVILKRGGTISHQHGVGTDHLQYLPAEKGPVGMQALSSILKTFDPQGLLNPGKLIDN